MRYRKVYLRNTATSGNIIYSLMKNFSECDSRERSIRPRLRHSNKVIEAIRESVANNVSGTAHKVQLTQRLLKRSSVA